MSTFNYELSANQLQALGELLKLVHYDFPAMEYYLMLPEQLRKDTQEENWKCDYTFSHTREWCGNDTCRES